MAPLPGAPWRASPRGVRSAILVALVGLLLSGFQPLVDGGNSETHAGVPSGKRTAGKLREEGIEFQGSPDGYGGFAPSADAAGVPPDAGRARGSSKASKGSKRKTTSTGSSQGTWSTGPSAASPSGYAPDAFGTGTDGHQPGLRDTVQLGGGHPQMVDVTGLHAIGAPAEVVTGTAGSGYTNPTFSGPNAHAPSVSILPPFLDWKERPLCSPSVSNVDIINTSEQAELLILSLSTDNIQYYPANFRQTSVAPGQKATISIVYLPRTLGMTDGTMIIQTSVGGFLIQMHGQGVPSPYHVEPLLGAKVPAGVSYGYVLHVHNPTDEVLKVKEVYTNEDFLRLSLPRVGGGGAVAGQEVGAIEDGGAGKEPGPARLWEVPPRSTKPIISLEFVSHTPGKYLGLVHIKTSRDSLIMPVDIHAIKGGIYRNPEEIDFGTLTAPTEQRTRSVALLNSSPNPILVSDVYASSPDLNLNINFKKAKGVVLAPGVEREVASVSYVGRTEGRVVAKIFLRTNDTNAVNNRLEIPYKVRVLHGSIAYDQERIAFHAGMPDKNGDFPVQTRQLRLKNLFPVPLVFYSAKVEDPLFQITEFLSGISIPAGFKAPPLTLRFQANGTDLMYTTQLLLSTNVSQLSVPVHVFHGNLEHSLEPNPFALLGSPAPTDLDFGVLGVNEQRVREFNVSNPNPVPVAISRVESSLPEVAVRLEKVVNSEGNPAPLHLDEEPVEDAEGGGKKKKKGKKGSKATSTAGGSWGSAASELGAAGAEHVVTLQPGHRAVFSASLQSPAETAREGKLAVYTRQQDLHVTMRYETLKGSLSVTPSSIRFDPSFPGRLQGKPLFAKSTYSRPLTITSLLSSDPRIVAVLNGAALEPGVKSEIGQLIFDPSRCPPEDNYMADLSVGGASGLTGPGDPSLSKHDLQALRRRELAWETLESRGDTDFAASLVMHTNVIQGYSLAVRASLEKPTVVPEDVLQFPLTQIGGVHDTMVSLYNPADQPLHVSLVPIGPNSTDPGGGGSGLVGGPGGLAGGEGPFSIAPNAVVDAIIPPHEWLEAGPVRFSPKTRAGMEATLYIRNNLTLLSSLRLMGEGGSGHLVFEDAMGGGVVEERGARRGERGASLVFRLNSSQIGFREVLDGRSGRRQHVLEGGALPWPVRVSQSFHAANRGTMPLELQAVRLKGGGSPCSSRGFSLTSCPVSPVVLQPGEAQAVEIVFEPDFTASVVRETLVVDTGAGRVEFAVVGEMPHELLPRALAAVPQGAAELTVRVSVTAGLFAVMLFMVRMVMRDFGLVEAGSPSPGGGAKPAPAGQSAAPAPGGGGATAAAAAAAGAAAAGYVQDSVSDVAAAAAAAAAERDGCRSDDSPPTSAKPKASDASENGTSGAAAAVAPAPAAVAAAGKKKNRKARAQGASMDGATTPPRPKGSAGSVSAAASPQRLPKATPPTSPPGPVAMPAPPTPGRDTPYHSAATTPTSALPSPAAAVPASSLAPAATAGAARPLPDGAAGGRDAAPKVAAGAAPPPPTTSLPPKGPKRAAHAASLSPLETNFVDPNLRTTPGFSSGIVPLPGKPAALPKPPAPSGKAATPGRKSTSSSPSPTTAGAARVSPRGATPGATTPVGGSGPTTPSAGAEKRERRRREEAEREARKAAGLKGAAGHSSSPAPSPAAAAAAGTKGVTGGSTPMHSPGVQHRKTPSFVDMTDEVLAHTPNGLDSARRAGGIGSGPSSLSNSAAASPAHPPGRATSFNDREGGGGGGGGGGELDGGALGAAGPALGGLGSGAGGFGGLGGGGSYNIWGDHFGQLGGAPAQPSPMGMSPARPAATAGGPGPYDAPHAPRIAPGATASGSVPGSFFTGGSSAFGPPAAGGNPPASSSAFGGSAFGSFTMFGGPSGGDGGWGAFSGGGGGDGGGGGGGGVSSHPLDEGSQVLDDSQLLDDVPDEGELFSTLATDKELAAQQGDRPPTPDSPPPEWS